MRTQPKDVAAGIRAGGVAAHGHSFRRRAASIALITAVAIGVVAGCSSNSAKRIDVGPLPTVPNTQKLINHLLQDAQQAGKAKGFGELVAAVPSGTAMQPVASAIFRGAPGSGAQWGIVVSEADLDWRGHLIQEHRMVASGLASKNAIMCLIGGNVGKGITSLSLVGSWRDPETVTAGLPDGTKLVADRNGIEKDETACYPVL